MTWRAANEKMRAANNYDARKISVIITLSRREFTCGAHLARSINKNIIRIFSHFSLYCRLYGNNFYMTSHEPALVSPTEWVIACAQTKITKQAILQIFRCDTCSDSYTWFYSLLSKPSIINECALILRSLTRDDTVLYHITTWCNKCKQNSVLCMHRRSKFCCANCCEATAPRPFP